MASARDYAFVVFRSNWENPQISHAAVDDGGTRSVMEAIRWGGGGGVMGCCGRRGQGGCSTA